MIKHIIAFGLFTSVSVGAQHAPLKTLGPREAEFHVQWTNVMGVRELRDGRVVVLDARDQAVKLIDMKSGKSTMIGRKGSGPGEYQLPGRLLALPGDSSVVFDHANSGTPMVVTPEGKAGGFLPGQPQGGFVDASSEVDGAGRVYSVGHGFGADHLSAIERLNRANGRRDTAAFVSRTQDKCSVQGSAPERGVARNPAGAEGGIAKSVGHSRAFLAIDQWSVSTDGRVAVVCPDPYRVTITSPAGVRTTGPVIPYDRIPVREGEKQRWRDGQHQPLAGMHTEGNKTVAGYLPAPPTPDPEQWPEYLPAMLMPSRALNGAVMFAPNGMLWIARHVVAGSAPLCDVIGRDGRLVYRVALPKQTRLVGFGANSVYLVRIDDDDLEYLQRYPLPR